MTTTDDNAPPVVAVASFQLPPSLVVDESSVNSVGSDSGIGDDDHFDGKEDTTFLAKKKANQVQLERKSLKSRKENIAVQRLRIVTFIVLFVTACIVTLELQPFFQERIVSS